VFGEKIGKESLCGTTLEPKPLCTSHSTDSTHLHSGCGLQMKGLLEQNQPIKTYSIGATESNHTRLMNFHGHDVFLSCLLNNNRIAVFIFVF
jgi:hypothetical protein